MGSPLLHSYKETIFYNDTLKEQLVQSLQERGIEVGNFNDAIEALFFDLSDYDLQLILAPFLRDLAIHTLKTSKSELCQGFREEYEKTVTTLSLIEREEGDYSSLEEFYQGQGSAHVYASDVEARVLAEILELNIAVTPTDWKCQAVGQAVSYYHREEHSHQVHLYNLPQAHFFIEEGEYGSSIGDGNCLYNGFAQHLRFFLLVERLQERDLVESSFFQEMFPLLAHLTMRELSTAIMQVLRTGIPDDESALELRQKELAKLDKLNVLEFQQRIHESVKEQGEISREELAKIAARRMKKVESSTKEEQKASYLEAYRLASEELLRAIEKEFLSSELVRTPIHLKELSSLNTLAANLLGELAKLIRQKQPKEREGENVQPSVSNKEDESKAQESMLALTLSYLQPYTPLFASVAIGLVAGALAASLGVGLLPALVIGGASTLLASGGFFACLQRGRESVIEPTNSPSPL